MDQIRANNRSNNEHMEQAVHRCRGLPKLGLFKKYSSIRHNNFELRPK